MLVTEIYGCREALLDSDCLNSLADSKWDREVNKGIFSLKLILPFKANAHINMCLLEDTSLAHTQKIAWMAEFPLPLAFPDWYILSPKRIIH